MTSKVVEQSKQTESIDENSDILYKLKFMHQDHNLITMLYRNAVNRYREMYILSHLYCTTVNVVAMYLYLCDYKDDCVRNILRRNSDYLSMVNKLRMNITSHC